MLFHLNVTFSYIPLVLAGCLLFLTLQVDASWIVSFSERLIPLLIRLFEEPSGKYTFIDHLQLNAVQILRAIVSSPAGLQALLPHLSSLKSLLQNSFNIPTTSSKRSSHTSSTSNNGSSTNSSSININNSANSHTHHDSSTSGSDLSKATSTPPAHPLSSEREKQYIAPILRNKLQQHLFAFANSASSSNGDVDGQRYSHLHSRHHSHDDFASTTPFHINKPTPLLPFEDEPPSARARSGLDRISARDSDTNTRDSAGSGAEFTSASSIGPGMPVRVARGRIPFC